VIEMKPGYRVRAGFVGLLLVMAAPWSLVGCGGGGGSPDAPAYALDIDPPAAASTSVSEAVLTGHGFLPPGSTCNGECAGLLPPPVFGQLGPYTLGWRNEASGESGALRLAWVCNCGGGAPYWIGRVPLAPGANRITVTMAAGGYTQAASVNLNRV
jgi:hypothetical protein